MDRSWLCLALHDAGTAAEGDESCGGRVREGIKVVMYPTWGKLLCRAEGWKGPGPVFQPWQQHLMQGQRLRVVLHHMLPHVHQYQLICILLDLCSPPFISFRYTSLHAVSFHFIHSNFIDVLASDYAAQQGMTQAIWNSLGQRERLVHQYHPI